MRGKRGGKEEEEEPSLTMDNCKIFTGINTTLYICTFRRALFYRYTLYIGRCINFLDK